MRGNEQNRKIKTGIYYSKQNCGPNQQTVLKKSNIWLYKEFNHQIKKYNPFCASLGETHAVKQES